jgi:hypothetical protein
MIQNTPTIPTPIGLRKIEDFLREIEDMKFFFPLARKRFG